MTEQTTQAPDESAQACIDELKRQRTYIEALEHDVKYFKEAKETAEAQLAEARAKLNTEMAEHTREVLLHTVTKHCAEKFKEDTARLRAALEAVEWGEAEWCDGCKSHQWDGHTQTCIVKAALNPRGEESEGK